jgi:hypothetical protein
MIPVPPIWVFDLECYRDYFLIALKNVYSRQIESYEFYLGIEPDYERIKTSLTTKQLISFNGINYDIPLLQLFFANNDNATLKKASDAIIVENMRPWELETMYGGADFHPDHIDLIEVAPGMVGLKLYGGRMHSQRLQDLPIDPSANITPADRPILKDYCINDLNTTIDMYFQLKPQIDLRVAMSAKYDIDLRSKSDAQIAEAVIRQEVQKKVGRKIYRPDISPDYTFKYRIPEFVSFTAPGMQKVLEIIRNATFTINEKGSVELPQIFESMRICIGSGTYTMGIGGLHSNESCSSHVSNENVFLKDRDVTSYYPSIILNQSLYPAHMGEAFLEVYQGIVSQRIEAKRTGDKVTNEAMKIMINGSFGKFGSKWSVLYSPDLLIQTTVTGQLALLMLIENIELAGFTVVSANTDGIVIKGYESRVEDLNCVISYWEAVTGFNTEETEYRALYSKDVNNYVAIKPSGEVKLKGLYAPAGMQKNVTNSICVEAVIEYLRSGTPVPTTIMGCSDVRKFITIRQVNGGAKYDGQYLGKAVRWYYRKGEARSIRYAANNNKVARSDGAFPLMELPPALPQDVDYDWYIKEAQSILNDVGHA